MKLKMLVPWKESYDKPRQCIKKWSVLKSTLPTKMHIVKAMVFPVVMSGCESWTIKKADYFGGLQIPLQMVTAAMKLKDAYSLEGKL